MSSYSLLFEHNLSLKPLTFHEISGWADQDFQKVLKAFSSPSLSHISRPMDDRFTPLVQKLHELQQKAILENALHSPQSAQQFWEDHFYPMKVILPPITEKEPPLLTGYFEPELEAQSHHNDEFSTPLLHLPNGHRRLSEIAAERVINGVASPLPSRGDYIQAFHAYQQKHPQDIFDENDIIAWLRPIDAYFVHIQGSAILYINHKTHCTPSKVTYAGRNGLPYASIGRYLIEQKIIDAKHMCYETLVTWLSAHKERQNDIFAHNPSFIYFQESKNQDLALGPIAGAGIALSENISIAIDRSYYPYHLPIWIEAQNRKKDKLGVETGLKIAQDTGAAIKGAHRADLFCGRGQEAALRAGALQQPIHFILLLPFI